LESIPKTGFCVPKESLEVQNADFPKAIGMTDAINWSSVLPKDDPDTAVMIWQNKFLDIMDECLPVQCLPQRRRLPWLTRNVVRHAFNMAKNNNFSDMKSYESLQNKVIGMLRKEKASYFKKLKPSNMKQFWKTVKSLRKSHLFPHFIMMEPLLPQMVRKIAC